MPARFLPSALGFAPQPQQSALPAACTHFLAHGSPLHAPGGCPMYSVLDIARDNRRVYLENPFEDIVSAAQGGGLLFEHDQTFLVLCELGMR
eukprot:3397808-Rhodomonas_salina.1